MFKTLIHFNLDVSSLKNELEYQRNQLMKFGPDIEEVSDVAISFSSDLQEPRDVDEGSDESETTEFPETTKTSSQSPIIDSGCSLAKAASLLICTVFFL